MIPFGFVWYTAACIELSLSCSPEIIDGALAFWLIDFFPGILLDYADFLDLYYCPLQVLCCRLASLITYINFRFIVLFICQFWVTLSLLSFSYLIFPIYLLFVLVFRFHQHFDWCTQHNQTTDWFALSSRFAYKKSFRRVGIFSLHVLLLFACELKEQ